jgi:phosphatidylserine decarboxylase
VTRYGTGTLTLIFLFPAIFSIGAYMTDKQSLLICAGISWLFFIFSCYFFRDPRRVIPEGEGVVVSPADGKIIDISRNHEHSYFDQKVTKISIFLSIFDVHINRIPMSGKVTCFDYQHGRFTPAFRSTASSENEHTLIGIENDSTKLLFKQIAGILARRIVCDVRAGHTVHAGEKFGMIKFGSRVDIFIPENIDINVTLNQRVKAGETVIGHIKEK